MGCRLFIELLKKLDICIKMKMLNSSPIREVILKELAHAGECLCSQVIHERVQENYQKKVSYNTVYRVLKLFEECGLVISIQNDLKKSIFCIKSDEHDTYILDLNSDTITPLVSSSTSKELLKKHSLNNADSFIVIHRK